jgi:hypothetical protein
MDHPNRPAITEADQQALRELRADIQTGLDDLSAGRVVALNIEAIIAKGRQRLATLSPST